MIRYHWAFALATALLAGCGTPPGVPEGPPPAPPELAASGELNEVEFTGAVTKYEQHTPYAYLEASGKPRLLGARVTASYFMWYVGGKYAGWKHVFLGKDGGLYVAADERWKQHPETGLALGDAFHAIGTFERRATYVEGDPLKLRFAPGVKLVRHYENQLVKVYKHLEVRVDALPTPVMRPALLPAADVAERKR